VKPGTTSANLGKRQTEIWPLLNKHAR
jgi:hypothetical protein